MTEIISNVIKIPKLEPASWSDWWNIWNINAKPLHKVIKNHNGLPSEGLMWLGFDLYRSNFYDPALNPYKSELVDCSSALPNLNNFVSLLPFKRVDLIRAVQSVRNVWPHRDIIESPSFQIRSLLYDDNPKENFYYHRGRSRKYQLLPESSNTWIYRDDLVFHGSTYYSGFKKILIAYYGIVDNELANTIMSDDSYINYRINLSDIA